MATERLSVSPRRVYRLSKIARKDQHFSRYSRAYFARYSDPQLNNSILNYSKRNLMDIKKCAQILDELGFTNVGIGLLEGASIQDCLITIEKELIDIDDPAGFEAKALATNALMQLSNSSSNSMQKHRYN